MTKIKRISASIIAAATVMTLTASVASAQEIKQQQEIYALQEQIDNDFGWLIGKEFSIDDETFSELSSMNSDSAKIADFNTKTVGIYYSINSINAIPSKYWGAYNTEDWRSYIQINSGTDVVFYGNYDEHGTILCTDCQAIRFEPHKSGNNFSFVYNSYTRIQENDQNTKSYSPVILIGHFAKGAKKFTISEVDYYHA